MGNKNLSQIISLLFLALWHGTYSGYYVNFGIELLVVTVEKDVSFYVLLYTHFYMFRDLDYFNSRLFS
ncbi:unnamed protein product [Schistosoma mattheei]|uniref:MBOAT_2 domain-containing protein n=1 Tax=Schistosoma mattheei TaxID=31246 RepID=A0A3P8K675_9TREM|nr:unnamed protein product [Schistosoma mattheei]